MRIRLYVESALSVIAVAVLTATVVTPDWIERVFGWSPDGGDGVTERALVLALSVTAVFLTRRALATAELWARSKRDPQRPTASAGAAR